MDLKVSDMDMDSYKVDLTTILGNSNSNGNNNDNYNDNRNDNKSDNDSRYKLKLSEDATVPLIQILV